VSSSSADPGGWKGDEKAHGPGVLIEKLIPGHLAEVRPSSRKEPSKTMHPSRVTMPILPKDVMQVLLAH